MHSKDTFKLLKVVVGADHLWHLSDEAGRTVWSFVDYLLDCYEVERLSLKTIENRAYSLAAWHRFLFQKNIGLCDVSDATLLDFRAHISSREQANASPDAQARRRTANLHLRAVYGYYLWIQRTPKYSRGLSLIDRPGASITGYFGDKKSASPSGRRYPALFRNAGERSKHRLAFVPNEDHRSALIEHFFRTYPPSTARRNCLIFELAWSVGWRRGSILSLLASDFDAAREDASNEIWVRPGAQKFGYTNFFAVPGRVAAQVLHYIDTERQSISANFAAPDPHLFLNLKSGRSINPQAVSNIFARARRALGWPVGAGLHAWRRGFANAYLEREIDARLELGLDTGGEAIAMSLASALGHESLSSQAAYIRDAQRRLKNSATFRSHDARARLREENLKLLAELSELRRRIGEAS